MEAHVFIINALNEILNVLQVIAVT